MGVHDVNLEIMDSHMIGFPMAAVTVRKRTSTSHTHHVFSRFMKIYEMFETRQSILDLIATSPKLNSWIPTVKTVINIFNCECFAHIAYNNIQFYFTF